MISSTIFSSKTSRLVAKAGSSEHTSTPAVRQAAGAKKSSKSPLIERLGGPDVVKVAVDVFYGKVLADDRVKHYFDSTNMAKQKEHQAAFMTVAFGGANAYQGKDMAEAHRHLVPHLTEDHFNAIVENFVSTLEELNVPQSDIDDAVAVVASTKEQVLAD